MGSSAFFQSYLNLSGYSVICTFGPTWLYLYFGIAQCNAFLEQFIMFLHLIYRMFTDQNSIRENHGSFINLNWPWSLLHYQRLYSLFWCFAVILMSHVRRIGRSQSLIFCLKFLGACNSRVVVSWSMPNLFFVVIRSINQTVVSINKYLMAHDRKIKDVLILV